MVCDLIAVKNKLMPASLLYAAKRQSNICDLHPFTIRLNDDVGKFKWRIRAGLMSKSFYIESSVHLHGRKFTGRCPIHSFMDLHKKRLELLLMHQFRFEKDKFNRFGKVQLLGALLGRTESSRTS